MYVELDKFTSKYNPFSEEEIENKIIIEWCVNRILKKIDKNNSILELGIGHGLSTSKVCNFSNNYTVIEGSSKVINNFKKNYPSVQCKIINQYFEKFSCQKKYDIIIMGFVLEHLENPFKVLKRYKKFLNPNGKLFISVPNAKSLNRRIGLSLGKIQNIYDLNENDIKLGHKRQFCLDKLSDCVKKSGYKIINKEGLYLKPLPLSFLKKLDNFEKNLQAMMEIGVNYPDLSVGILLEVVIDR